MNKKPAILSRFLGLNNVADPMIGTVGQDGKPLTWSWLSQADNVDVSDQGHLVRRSGFVPFVAGSNIKAAFTTFDFSRMYVVDGGVLLEVLQDGTTIELWDGLAGPYRWAETNGMVFLSCSEKLQIHRNRDVQSWVVPTPTGGVVTQVSGGAPQGLYQICFTHMTEDGREGGASASIPVALIQGGMSIEAPMVEGHYTVVYLAARGTVFRALVVLTHAHAGPYVIRDIDENALGRELANQFLDSLPAGVEYIAHRKGRMYGAEYLPNQDQTVIWFSQPLGYHLFNLNQDFFLVPGRVLQLADADTHLLVATGERIYLYSEEGLTQVAEYGVVPGQHADRGNDGKTYFWATRGLCRVAPFENLTEGRVSVAPGIQAGGGVIHEHGRVRYVATLHRGGAAFNPRKLP